jgi:hypothetical protein
LAPDYFLQLDRKLIERRCVHQLEKLGLSCHSNRGCLNYRLSIFEIDAKGSKQTDPFGPDHQSRALTTASLRSTQPNFMAKFLSVAA